MSLFQKGFSAQTTAFATRPRPITPGVRSPLQRVRQPRRYNSSHSKPDAHAEGKVVEDGLPANQNAPLKPAQSNSPSPSPNSATHSAQPVNTAAGAAGAATSPAAANVIAKRGLRDVISAGPLGRFGRWYSRVQERKPYQTQLGSSVVIYLCGDLSAQLFFPSEAPPPAKSEQEETKNEDEKEERRGGYDPWRTVRHLIVGTGSSIPSYKW